MGCFLRMFLLFVIFDPNNLESNTTVGINNKKRQYLPALNNKQLVMQGFQGCFEHILKILND